MAKSTSELEIAQSWIRARQRGELTLDELAAKLQCGNTEAQARVDASYRAAMERFIVEKQRR